MPHPGPLLQPPHLPRPFLALDPLWTPGAGSRASWGLRCPSGRVSPSARPPTHTPGAGPSTRSSQDAAPAWSWHGPSQRARPGQGSSGRPGCRLAPSTHTPAPPAAQTPAQARNRQRWAAGQALPDSSRSPSGSWAPQPRLCGCGSGAGGTCTPPAALNSTHTPTSRRNLRFPQQPALAQEPDRLPGCCRKPPASHTQTAAKLTACPADHSRRGLGRTALPHRPQRQAPHPTAPTARPLPHRPHCQATHQPQRRPGSSEHLLCTQDRSGRTPSPGGRRCMGTPTPKAAAP